MARVILGGLFLLVACWTAAGCGESGNGNNVSNGIVIGGILADDVDPLSLQDVKAIRMAIEEINASGAFDRPLRLVNRSPARGDIVDPEKAAEGVMALYDEDRAVGFVGGHGYETVYRMIEVTNSEPYQDFVQCAYSASDPGANMPGMSGADANDTFYRTVTTYQSHLDLGTILLLENQWHQVGLFRFDNASGQELSLGVRLKVGEHTGDGFSLAFDQPVPNEAFDVEANRQDLDRIAAMSRNDKVDVSIIAVLQAQSIGISKYLVDSGYQGCLFQTAGSQSADMFQIVTGLSSWLEAGNVMIGVEPDAYQGENSAAFVQAYADAYGQQPSNFGSTAYDCTYALALSLLYAGPDGQNPAGVKAGMSNFKESNRTADEESVGIGADEFARAAELIRAGKRVDFQGASGRLLFDDNGDRPKMGMRSFGPNSSATEWEVKDRYDEDLNKLPDR